MPQCLETPLIFISLFSRIDTCKKTAFYKFHVAVQIDLLEEVYYLKQVFYFLFLKFHITVKIYLNNNNNYFLVLFLRRAHSPVIKKEKKKEKHYSNKQH